MANSYGMLFYRCEIKILNMDETRNNTNNKLEQTYKDEPLRTMSDNDGPSPTPTVMDGDTDGQRRTMTEKQHILTTNEVLDLFEAAGLSRSQRSIERYCGEGKLDCIKDPDEGRHYITPESVDRLINHLKEIAARHEQPKDNPTVSNPHQKSRESETNSAPEDNAQYSEESASLRARTERLQHEIAFKDLYIEKLEEEREKDKDRLVNLGQQVGKLGIELKMLTEGRTNIE